jgi:hypothetical protein
MPTEGALPDDIGLSIDMLDVDRLREWARLLLVHGPDVSYWGSVAFVVTRMQIMATDIEKAVRDIGRLRAAHGGRKEAATDEGLQRICEVVAQSLVRVETAETKYHELLYAVGNKHAGESRHETALRYIRQAEQSHGPVSAGWALSRRSGDTGPATGARMR